MKIECDKCGAKYSIADEKVRGKTFKIRCKKCSNVIIVRDKGAAAAGAAAAAAVDQSPGWHLAINGETVGPMSEDEVRQRYDAGEIDKETAIWQEGFEDWVPLGDVEVFASLPERAAAAAEDPFASANQDDYAAPAAVGAGAAVAAAGAAASAPVAEQRSPRVSQLTGQRNENSVLFSLDSLQALATGGGAAAAPAGRVGSPAPAPVAARAAANPSKGLATSAPSSEGSGLIDIRALGAMVGGGGAAAAGAAASPMPAADDAALPSFGGGGLGGLTSAPLVPQVAPVEQAAAAAAVQPQQARSQAPLYIMMTLLLLAVLGLVAFIALREPDTKIVKETVTQPAAAPSVADKDEEKDEDEDKDKGKDEDDDKDDGDEKSADDEDGEDEDGGDDGEAAVAGSSGKKKKSSGGGKKKTKSTSKSSSGGGGDPLAEALGGGDSSSSKSKKSSGGGDPGVECILDPSKCGGGGGSSSKKAAPKKAATDPNLPEKLTSTDIKNGVAPHKGAAKSCGGKHGAAPGEKVTVKLSIAGATGNVTSASAIGKHAGTPLGNCVAQALKKASFKKFQKSSLGVQYPIRF